MASFLIHIIIYYHLWPVKVLLYFPTLSHDFKIGRQIIHTVRYADDLVLLAKEEKVLQDMIDKLIEIGRCNGMEMNVEKTELMRIS
jgi:indole-3-glycerol phosphate synthase